uniref:Uncharacterized protein n=1 Tax=Chromera velia CCMP2878 TaxID=1169474 RepID=A0A0G4HU13_9ALVE
MDPDSLLDPDQLRETLKLVMERLRNAENLNRELVEKAKSMSSHWMGVMGKGRKEMERMAREVASVHTKLAESRELVQTLQGEKQHYKEKLSEFQESLKAKMAAQFGLARATAAAQEKDEKGKDKGKHPRRGKSKSLGGNSLVPPEPDEDDPNAPSPRLLQIEAGFEELNLRLMVLTKDNARLEMNVKTANKKVEEEAERTKEAKREVTELKGQIEAMRGMLDDEGKRAMEAENKHLEVERSLTEAQAEIQSLRSTVETLKLEKQEKEEASPREVDEVKQQVQALADSLSATTTALQNEEAKRAEALMEAEEARGLVRQLEQEKEAEAARADEQEGMVRNIESLVEQLQKTKEEEMQRAEANRRGLEEEKQRNVQDLQTKVQSLQSENETYAARAKEVASAMEGFEGQIEKLKKQKEEEEARADASAHALESTRALLDQLQSEKEKEKARAEATINELRSENEREKARADAKLGELDGTQELVAQLRRGNEQEKARAEAKSDELENVHALLQGLQKEKEEQQHAAEESRAAIERLQGEVNRLQRIADEEQGRVVELMETVRSLEQQLAKAKSDLDAGAKETDGALDLLKQETEHSSQAEAERDSLRSKVTALESRINELDAELKSRDSSRAQLEAELSQKTAEHDSLARIHEHERSSFIKAQEADNEKIQNLTERLHEAEKETARVRELLKSVDEDAQKQMRDTQNKAAAHETHLQAKISAIRGENEECRRSSIAKTAEAEELKKRLEEAQAAATVAATRAARQVAECSVQAESACEACAAAAAAAAVQELTSGEWPTYILKASTSSVGLLRSNPKGKRGSEGDGGTDNDSGDSVDLTAVHARRGGEKGTEGEKIPPGTEAFEDDELVELLRRELGNREAEGEELKARLEQMGANFIALERQASESFGAIQRMVMRLSASERPPSHMRAAVEALESFVEEHEERTRSQTEAQREAESAKSRIVDIGLVLRHIVDVLGGAPPKDPQVAPEQVIEQLLEIAKNISEEGGTKTAGGQLSTRRKGPNDKQPEEKESAQGHSGPNKNKRERGKHPAEPQFRQPVPEPTAEAEGHCGPPTAAGGFDFRLSQAEKKLARVLHLLHDADTDSLMSAIPLEAAASGGSAGSLLEVYSVSSSIQNQKEIHIDRSARPHRSPGNRSTIEEPEATPAANRSSFPRRGEREREKGRGDMKMPGVIDDTCSMSSVTLSASQVLGPSRRHPDGSGNRQRREDDETGEPRPHRGDVPPPPSSAVTLRDAVRSRPDPSSSSSAACRILASRGRHIRNGHREAGRGGRYAEEIPVFATAADFPIYASHTPTSAATHRVLNRAVAPAEAITPSASEFPGTSRGRLREATNFGRLPSHGKERDRETPSTHHHQPEPQRPPSQRARIPVPAASKDRPLSQWPMGQTTFPYPVPESLRRHLGHPLTQRPRLSPAPALPTQHAQAPFQPPARPAAACEVQSAAPGGGVPHTHNYARFHSAHRQGDTRLESRERERSPFLIQKGQQERRQVEEMSRQQHQHSAQSLVPLATERAAEWQSRTWGGLQGPLGVPNPSPQTAAGPPAVISVRASSPGGSRAHQAGGSVSYDCFIEAPTSAAFPDEEAREDAGGAASVSMNVRIEGWTEERDHRYRDDGGRGVDRGRGGSRSPDRLSGTVRDGGGGEGGFRDLHFEKISSVECRQVEPDALTRAVRRVFR